MCLKKRGTTLSETYLNLYDNMHEVFGQKSLPAFLV